MKRLTLEEIEVYMKSFNVLDPCICQHHSESSESIRFLRLKCGIILVSRFFNEVGIECSFSLPKHSKEEIEDEVLSDYWDEYTNILEEMLERAYSVTGWEMKWIEVLQSVKSFIIDMPDGEELLEQLDDESLRIDTKEIINIWKVSMRSFLSETLMQDESDFNFIEEALLNSVISILNLNLNINYMMLFKNKTLGLMLHNIQRIPVNNSHLFSVIYELVEEVSTLYSVHVAENCTKGLTSTHDFLIVETDFYDPSTGETIDDSVINIKAIVYAVLLHQAILLAQEEQPELFEERVTTPHKEVAYAVTR